jgi:radical SAM superfamily enzyme YgiQ (UPF0313 family)
MKKVLLSTFSIQFQDWLPYAAGCLISYCKKDEYVAANYEFLEPEFIARQTKEKVFQDKLAQADIIGFTCYIWNQEINDEIAKEYKKNNPNGIVIYGGPQVPEDYDDAEKFCNERPYVDVHFVGPAEENFRKFLCNIDEPFSSHDGTVGIGWNNVSVDRKLYKVNWTPTPYTDGTLTHMLKYESDNLVIPMETNRGCPYACAFCDWGSVTKSKITKFDNEEINKVIQLAFEGNISRIEFIDANFGIFEDDLKYIQEMVKQKYINDKEMKVTFCGLAKNGSKWLPDIMTTIQKEFEENNNTMKISIQTHTEEALRVADRSNISNDRMMKIYNEVKKEGYDINSELIIGMPGETAETWLDVLQKDIDNGCAFNRAYPLSVMQNTTYYSKEFREKYKANLVRIHAPKDLLEMKLTYYHENRHNAKDIKTTCDPKVINQWRTIEMFNSCYSYDTNELEKMYMYWFWFTTLFNTGLAKKYMLESNLSIREQAYEFFEKIDQMPTMKKFLELHQYAFRKNLKSDATDIWLDDLLSVTYIIKTHMRLHEVCDIYDNIDQVAEELRVVYPNFTTEHIIPHLEGRQYYKLYSADGAVGQ